MSQIDAKSEFLEHIKDRIVLCASLTFGADYHETQTKVILCTNYTRSGYKMFLKKLEHNYDNGYGGQELFGTIWYTDGTYSDRGEYDGSEWWEHRVSPEIPKECK